MQIIGKLCFQQLENAIPTPFEHYIPIIVYMFGNMIVQDKPTRTGCFGNKSGILAKNSQKYH